MLSFQNINLRVIHNVCFVSKILQQKKSAHRHNCIEMFYIVSGTSEHTLYSSEGNITTTLNAGNYMVLDSSAAHSFRNGTSNFCMINFLFLPQLVNSTLKEDSSFDEIKNVIFPNLQTELKDKFPVNCILFDTKSKLLPLFEKAYKAFDEEPLGHINLLHCYAIEIMVSIMNSAIKHKYKMPQNDTIKNICDYIEEHYAESITLKEICLQEHYAFSYISKKFKQICGVTFEQYLQNLRMRRACELLLETNLSIDAVANSVNYSNTDCFRKTFKKHTGKSPSEFRKLFIN